jgi:hypothetical protein
MAVNTNQGHRKGAVKQRSQFYNAATGHYIKRDTETGRILEVKRDGSPFKGVRKEVSEVVYKANSSIKKSIAIKAERAVIKVLGKK